MNKKWKALLCAAAVALSVISVGYKKAEPGTTFTVMTWNILHGNGQIASQQEQVKSYSPDLLLLQEVDVGTRRIGGGSNMLSMAEGLYENMLYGDASAYDCGTIGNALLTKGTLSNEDDLLVQDSAQIQKGYFHTNVQINGVSLSVYNVHLEYRRSDWRAQQLYSLSLEVAADKSKYIIVAGDFNLQDFSELNVLDSLTALNNDETYYSTYHGLDWNTQAIDNILYTADTLALQAAEMPVNGLSDHNALVATFAVK
jgi:endonuclease/exonuclease/phosphatase family metal-dependent hydrolase